MSPIATSVFFAAVALCGASTVNYNGTWHNQLGSYMNVTVSPDGYLTGLYYTSLPTGHPLAGVGMTGFAGMAENSTNSLFGFVAKWPPTYIVSWSGEYKICDGVHVLFTDFILKPATTLCRDSPLSTRSGKDCFTRFRQIPEDGEQCAADQVNPCNSPC